MKQLKAALLLLIVIGISSCGKSKPAPTPEGVDYNTVIELSKPQAVPASNEQSPNTPATSPGTVIDNVGELVIEINGFESDSGQLMIGIFKSKDSFISEKADIDIRTKIVSGKATAILKGLAYGAYTFSFCQDINSNNLCDTGWFGAPTEPYGFSNDATFDFGLSPDKIKSKLFDDMLFEFNSKQLIKSCFKIN